MPLFSRVAIYYLRPMKSSRRYELDETILFGSGMEMTDFASPGVFGTVFLGLTNTAQ